PAGPALVAGIGGAAVAAFDVVLLIVRPGNPIPAFLHVGVQARVLPLLAVGIAALAAAAAVRTFGRPGWFRWVAGAAAATAIAALGTAGTYLLGVQWMTYVAVGWQTVM